ncbi:histidine phosphatase family protein [Aestuariibius sp. 2305UL40-4]|uniref:histidine phosphatase family protein n=1 Tax=Aestuariibius violaceus TaxID=3234132 RepID=UPI00345ED30E
MTKRLWLIRHGPTHAKTMVGWTDLAADLSDTAALNRLGDALPSSAHMISSDLSRAKSTADSIPAGRLRLPHDPNLRELHFGAWEDRTFADIDAETPDHLRAFWETPGPIAPPDGESWNDLRARTDTAIDQLIAEGPEDIAIVCHFGPVLTQIQRALDLDAVAAFRIRIDPLSLTIIERHEGAWSVRGINWRP